MFSLDHVNSLIVINWLWSMVYVRFILCGYLLDKYSVFFDSSQLIYYNLVCQSTSPHCRSTNAILMVSLHLLSLTCFLLHVKNDNHLVKYMLLVCSSVHMSCVVV